MPENTDLIRDYDPDWVSAFNALRRALSVVLLTKNISIEHIGSTAVKGLAAKPIIDIDIVYYDHSMWPQILQGLQNLDYRHVGDQGVTNREVFKRMNSGTHPVLDRIRHHLYVCPSHSQELKRHLQFRDHLRKNPVDRARYEKLKRTIAAEADQDRKRYAQIKQTQASDFITSILLSH